MILLYQDPKGEKVGTTTFTGISSTATKVNLELESKVASLEKLITELKNENEALKVSDPYLIAMTLLCYYYINLFRQTIPRLRMTHQIKINFVQKSHANFHAYVLCRF